jgi:RNase P subunit RPR2
MEINKRIYSVRSEVLVLYCANCRRELESGNSQYTSNPPQMDFTCPACGSSVRLPLSDWPGIRHYRDELIQSE